MTTIRIATEKDLPRINSLLSEAFTHGRITDGYAEVYVPMMRLHMLKMYLSTCPDGCFLIQDSGTILAAAFSHVFGKTGWIGPIAVRPQAENRGFGKEITEECITYLKNKKCTTIGLETMPRSYRNLGFYTKLGFTMQQLTCELSRTVKSNSLVTQSNDVTMELYSEHPDDKFLEKIRLLLNSHHIFDDYSSLIIGTHEYSFGDTFLFLHNKKPVGFVIVHSKPYSTAEDSVILRVNTLFLNNNTDGNLLNAAIFHCEEFARMHSLSNLCIRVPANNWQTMQWLVSRNYKIIHSDLRLTLEKYDEIINPNVVHLSRWE